MRTDLPTRLDLSRSHGGILNLADNRSSGTHWCAYAYRPDWPCSVYFDTYGLPPPDSILRLLAQAGKPVYWPDAQMQEWDSTECGFYCTTFLKRALDPKMRFINVLDNFDKHPGARNEREALAGSLM